MIFGNPEALWLMFVIVLILGLGFWGWKVKREIAEMFGLNINRAKRSQIKKYIVSVAMLIFLISAFTFPQLPVLLSGGEGKTGEIILLVDTSGSMAAKENLDSPSRIERVKPILYEIIDRFPEAEFYPFHFTDLARSFTPPVTKEDFPYLKRSIARVLDVGSAPGSGSSFGKAFQCVMERIPQDEGPKVIVLFSDGEVFKTSSYQSYQREMLGAEEDALEKAIEMANQEGIKIITVGVGESEGATIPLYDEEGNFTGDYAQYNNKMYVTYLEEDILKEIALGAGGKYFSEDECGKIISCIGENLVARETEGRTDYREVSYLFLLPVIALWIIFVRHYFK